jgi:hypothetical protein
MFDPFQQPGNPGGQQNQFGGPLADIEQQVSGVLNSADTNHLYIPAGPGGIIQLPRPQGGYPVYTGSHRPGERLTPGDVGVLFLGLTVLAGVVAAIAGVALLFIK